MAVSARRPLRFGIQLQAQRVGWPEYLDAVRAVERLGFDTLWNFDHMLPFAGDLTQPCFETWTTLAAMAMATSRIRIGALVNGVMYRDPATLAKSAVQVDLISNGRLEFALGAAWAVPEFEAYGLYYPEVGERMSRLEEALAIVRSLWTQARTDHHGKYYTINNAPCEPKPIQQPHPPIMIGGNGNRTIRIAARHADIWNGFGTPPEVAERIAHLQSECDKIGRNSDEIEFSVHPSMVVARTHEEAEAKARAAAVRLDIDFDKAGSSWMVGTPDEVSERLRAYVEVGVSHWIFGYGAPFDLDGFELFATEVAPGLRKGQ